MSPISYALKWYMSKFVDCEPCRVTVRGPIYNWHEVSLDGLDEWHAYVEGRYV